LIHQDRSAGDAGQQAIAKTFQAESVVRPSGAAVSHLPTTGLTSAVFRATL